MTVPFGRLWSHEGSGIMSTKVVSIAGRSQSDLIAKEGKSRKGIIPGVPYPSDIEDLAKSGKFDLTRSEVQLLQALRNGMNRQKKSNWRSQKTLAEGMCCTRSTVNKAAKGLKIKGVITVHKHKRQKNMGFAGNEYRIVFPWPDSPRNGHTYAAKSPKREPEKQTHIRPISKHTCVRETDTNQSRVNKSKRISQSNNQGEPEAEDKLFQTDKADGSGRDEKIDGGRENLKEGEIFDLPEDSPPPATDDELKKIYGDKIPPPVDFSFVYNPDRDEVEEETKNFFLWDYLEPFKRYKHYKRYKTEGPGWWEDQLDDFWRKASPFMWSSGEKPRKGIIVIFKRAARAGLVYRLGFRPKIP